MGTNDDYLISICIFEIKYTYLCIEIIENMKLTKHQELAFRHENSLFKSINLKYANGFLPSLDDFNIRVQERITQLDRENANFWKESRPKRNAYFSQKFLNLAQYIKSAILYYKSFPKKVGGRDKILKRNAKERLLRLQLDFSILFNFDPIFVLSTLKYPIELINMLTSDYK